MPWLNNVYYLYRTSTLGCGGRSWYWSRSRHQRQLEQEVGSPWDLQVSNVRSARKNKVRRLTRESDTHRVMSLNNLTVVCHWDRISPRLSSPFALYVPSIITGFLKIFYYIWLYQTKGSPTLGELQGLMQSGKGDKLYYNILGVGLHARWDGISSRPSCPHTLLYPVLSLFQSTEQTIF